MLQEHNLREKNLICKRLSDNFDIFINLSVNQKGGTAILINKRLDYEMLNISMSADSRIISMNIKVANQKIHIVNVYAPASATNSERDKFFHEELLFYLRNNLNNVILAGDWNCILSKRDSTSDNTHVSKELLNIVRQLKCKDAWFLKNKSIEYTYVRKDYGSRIDRIYVKDFANYISEIRTKNVNFSDHSGVITKINLPNHVKIGKYYWKLNVSLLEDDNIKERFKNEWDKIKEEIYLYDTINNWWELNAKHRIKSFFISISKEKSQMKYGLLQMLELKLNRLYEKVNRTGQINYNEITEIKGRINSIKNDMLEGVKIRSRIEEQIEGEKISAYLIGKQATIKSKKGINEIKTEENIVDNINSGTILNNKDSIEWYIYKYYEKLYKKEESDNEFQSWFLEFVEKKLTQIDIQNLEKEVSEKEIFKAIKSLNSNKSPGIDGLPNEFYLKFWEIIKKEFCEIIINIIKGTLLKGSQKQAIITLIPKDGELNLLKSWRPVSQICSDVKIVAKILANRLNPIMPNIISKNQYCVNSRKIVECNSKIRDILYYAETNNMSGALINLDWEKAYDRVDWDFLKKIMNKIGFPEFIINWLMILYTNITSSCMVNGYITKEFRIERGVRQGCPLSMLVYVLFQEPLYLAIQKNSNILPIEIPERNTKTIGYADDTTICIKDDVGIIEVFNVIKKFVDASNSKINIKKTKIYGFGDWSNRVNWPIENLKIEMEYFSTLGITFSANYDNALSITWNKVCNKVKNGLAAITNRGMNIYQKAIIVNSMISSKIWYTSHIYPITMEHTKEINTNIFKYIWNSNTNPLKRDELYKKRNEGGLGLINIHIKAQSIFVNTMIKMFLNSNITSMIRYYLAVRANEFFSLNELPVVTSNTITPFYDYAIDIMKLCTNHKDFPNMTSKKIYEILMPKVKPKIENEYPLYDWKSIWDNISFKYIHVNDRPIIFKYIHEILPNNKRLYQIRLRTNDANCNFCEIEDSNIHKFYYCHKVQDCIFWVRKLIFYFCGLNINSLLEILSFNFPKISTKVKNTLSIIVSSYIACIWYNRENMESVIYILKAKIINDQRVKLRILGKKAKKIFTENYCKENIEFIYEI